MHSNEEKIIKKLANRDERTLLLFYRTHHKLLVHFFEKKIGKKEKNLLIESLYAHFFDADIVAVLRCKPKVLEKRLRKNYTWPTKIVENKEAEIIGLITQEAIDKHGKKKVFEFDTTTSPPEKTARQIVQVIRGSGRKYRAGRIDWLSRF